MKSRKLVTSRSLALMASQGRVLVNHGGLAISRTTRPPAKTPLQAAPIQSQIHNVASTIAPPSSKAPALALPVVKGNSDFLEGLSRPLLN
jgi:hypothetical protein